LGCNRGLLYFKFKTTCLTCAGSVPLWPYAGSRYCDFGHPRGDLIEVSSSSYGLCLFSSRAGSSQDEGAEAAPEASSSISMGELCRGFDQLDEMGPEVTSTLVLQSLLRDLALSSSMRLGSGRAGKGTSRAARGALVSGALGLSFAASKGYGGCSTKKKAVWILADASGAISPCMRRLFIDR
jgi:hypothetical protein